MTKKYDGEQKRPVKRKSKGSHRNNIVDFGHGKRKAENKASPPDARHMETAQISLMIVALERAIEKTEPLIDKPGCEHARVLVALYRWARDEFIAILDSPSPPDAARVKSLCELLEIDTGSD